MAHSLSLSGLSSAAYMVVVFHAWSTEKDVLALRVLCVVCLLFVYFVFFVSLVFSSESLPSVCFPFFFPFSPTVFGTGLFCLSVNVR